jgi:hypothetical protein
MGMEEPPDHGTVCWPYHEAEDIVPVLNQCAITQRLEIPEHGTN